MSELKLQKKVCSKCNEAKVCVKTGRKQHNGVSNVYVDENGNKWYGRSCPECHKLSRYITCLKSREKKKK